MNKKAPETKTEKRGRPRLHADGAGRVRAFRKRQHAKGRRIDAYIGDGASWRITKLSEAWGCSLGQVIDRLVMEADDRYESILFPVTEKD